MHEPLENADLLAFSKTVEARSLSRAAAELGVPRATVGRRLARLEEQLGVRLVRRTTRSLALTDAGEALHRHARIVLDAVSVAEASVKRTDGVLRGPLRVSVPPVTMPSFHAMVCDFAKKHPEVLLHIHFSSEHVDLIRSGYDVAIRASHTLEPGLVSRTLVRMPLIAVAAPSYLEKSPKLRDRRDLVHHRCLMGFERGALPASHWPFQRSKVHVEGAFFSNDVTMLCAAAVRGLGIALLPLLGVWEHLHRGELIHVLPGKLGVETRLSIVYPERELVPAEVRAFVDAVVAWAPSELPKLPPCPDKLPSPKPKKKAKARVKP